MSNPGFYSDIYQQIRTYAELVDHVIIGLKDNLKSRDPNREQLAEILDGFAEQEQRDLSVRIITIMLGDGTGENLDKWIRLRDRLRMSAPDRSLIDDLEQFAQVLEQQQADALAKMRGWSH